MMKNTEQAADSWNLAEAVREKAPLIHNITNLVVQNDTADAIAAVGGSQLTLHTEEEARGMAAISHGLAVNIGTLDASWLRCAHTAVEAANAAGTPWVLDPVGVGLTAYRTEAVHALLALGPAVIKGNASEILVLAGANTPGRGGDSVHQVEQAADAAREIAGRLGCVVVVSGARDLITDGRNTFHCANGHGLMPKMIGSGCMLTSVIACFLGTGGLPLHAALAAVAYFNVAGELAAEQAAGPGTLKPLFIDALFNLRRDIFESRVSVSPA